VANLVNPDYWEGILSLGLAPKVENAENTLSHISYHFRQLAEDGCLEVVKRVPRRGATEHVYRGSAAWLFFGDEEWEQMTMETSAASSPGT
jgi:hypothetical protein